MRTSQVTLINRILARAVLLALAVAIPMGIGSVPANADDLRCATSYDPNSIRLTGRHHPLVGVHGWLGNGESMKQTLTMISRGMPDTFDTMAFDYSNARTDWAAHPRIAQCLADFINAVSAKYKSATGDGRVYVVAHSMGGLATRFAADGRYAKNPIAPGALGGLTTLATPHLGAPFGNTGAGAVWQGYNELVDLMTTKMLAPDRHSDAVTCLARHDGGRQLPSGCAYPPYLPSGIPVGQIAGDITIRRTLFGQKLYDVDIRGDGIVSENSATSYLTSGPPGVAKPRMAAGYMQDVTCTTTTDATMAAVRTLVSGPNVPLNIIKAEIGAIALLTADSRLLDQILADEPQPDLLTLMVSLQVQPGVECNHNGMTTNPAAAGAVVESLKRQLQVKSSLPSEVVLRPFKTDGSPADGWSATGNLSNVGEVDCSYPERSPSSKSPGIQFCSPSAASADACYFAPNQTSGLCLQDPFSRNVARVTANGSITYGIAPPKEPTPIGIELDDGSKCRLRNGGSWSGQDQNPSYVGYFGCLGSRTRIVWADPASKGDGINRSATGWTVTVGDEHSALETRRVTTAYFVGTE